MKALKSERSTHFKYCFYLQNNYQRKEIWKYKTYSNKYFTSRKESSCSVEAVAYCLAMQYTIQLNNEHFKIDKKND